MIDFSKIYCKQHPNERVTNFCARNECATPLCPSCLCEHAQLHQQNGTAPDFENIRATYSRIHQEVQAQQALITDDMDRLNELMLAIKAKKTTFNSIIEQAKQECLEYVSKCFDELAQHWLKQIQQQQKRSNLHDHYRLQTISTLVKREMQRLIDQSRQLNSPGFEDLIKRTEEELLVDSLAFHNKIKSQLEENEQYNAALIYKKQPMIEFKEIVKKIVRLQFKIPIRRINPSITPSVPSSPAKRVNNSVLYCSTPKESNNDSRISFTSQREPSRASLSKKVSPMEVGASLQANLGNCSSFVTIPKVLTASLFKTNTAPKAELKILSNSSMIEKPRTSKANPVPQYGYGIDLSNFSKADKIENKSQSKKKSGLMVMTPKNESFIKEKENTQK